MKTRKEFQRLVAGSAAGTAMVRADVPRVKTDGAPMRNFRCAPMDRIRVGIVGLGARGSGAVSRLLQVPGLEITALCDIRKPFAEKAVGVVEKKTGRKPLVFLGFVETAEATKRHCMQLENCCYGEEELLALKWTSMISRPGARCASFPNVRHATARRRWTSPDFTRGAWKQKVESSLMTAAFDLNKLDVKKVEKAKGQLNV